MTFLGPYAGLSFRFTVECDNPVLAAQVGRVFASLTTTTNGPLTRIVVQSPRAEAPGHVSMDGRIVLQNDCEYWLYNHLLWELNQGAIRETTDKVLLHASAAEIDRRAIIMCAPSDSGKTTLVAGLIQAGMRYVTDEVVAIDPGTGWVAPFPKALAVDDGSWDVLADLRPPMVGAEHLMGRQWQVPPGSIRRSRISPGARPALVVLPRYARGGPTRLTPITPGTALVGLLQETFELPRQPDRDMKCLASVCDQTPSYRLDVSDLSAAVVLLFEALRAMND